MMVGEFVFPLVIRGITLAFLTRLEYDRRVRSLNNAIQRMRVAGLGLENFTPG